VKLKSEIGRRGARWHKTTFALGHAGIKSLSLWNLKGLRNKNRNIYKGQPIEA